MTDILVKLEQGERFRITVRGHELVVDQPLDEGGGDEGPSPVEIFVASLASCVAYYAGQYLRRHDIPVEGLAVECDFAFAKDRPARVGGIELRVIVPEGFPEGRRAGLLAVAEHCTVHNSIRRAPEVAISVRASAPAA
jgi:putative redox protein